MSDNGLGLICDQCGGAGEKATSSKKCEECKGPDIHDCWDGFESCYHCQGTGVQPIPWSELR